MTSPLHGRTSYTRTTLRLVSIFGLVGLGTLGFILYEDLEASVDAANQRVIAALSGERNELAKQARIIARLEQIQRGIQFRELEGTSSLFADLEQSLNVEGLYLLNREGRVLTEYPQRTPMTEFLPDRRKPSFEVRAPIAWVTTPNTTRLFISSMVRHPIERSMLGYVVIERRIDDGFANGISERADAEWLISDSTGKIQLISSGLLQELDAGALEDYLGLDGYRWRQTKIDVLPQGQLVYVALNQSNFNLILFALVVGLPLGLLWLLQDERRRALSTKRTLQASLDETQYDLNASRTELNEAREDLLRTLSERALAVQAKRDAELSLVRAERLATIGQMVSSIGHDMANPISAISMIASSHAGALDEFRELLYGNLDDSEGAQAFREVLDEFFSTFDDDLLTFKTGSSRLKDMIEALRRHGRKDDQKSEFQVAELVQETLLLSQARIVPHVAELKIPDDLEGYGHRSHLGQVVMNFLANAADVLTEHYRHSKETIGEIWVEASGQPHQWVISVSDNGPGVDDEIRNELFEPYFTTKGHQEGTGLGLAIAKTIIDEHLGTIKVDRHPTLGGARFTVTLPVAGKKT